MVIVRRFYGVTRRGLSGGGGDAGGKLWGHERPGGGRGFSSNGCRAVGCEVVLVAHLFIGAFAWKEMGRRVMEGARVPWGPVEAYSLSAIAEDGLSLSGSASSSCQSLVQAPPARHAQLIRAICGSRQREGRAAQGHSRWGRGDEELSIPEQTATGKGTSNPLMAGSLPKTTKPT
ncbi:hypothetical protein Tco_1532827 [Tanacetum coccineum]